MLKRFALIAILALSAALAQPAAANALSGDDLIMELARKQVEDARRQLDQSVREHGQRYVPPPPAPLPKIYIYRPSNVSDPERQPPGWKSMTIFDGYTNPITGPSRPSCMPYYPGCWK